MGLLAWATAEPESTAVGRIMEQLAQIQWKHSDLTRGAPVTLSLRHATSHCPFPRCYINPSCLRRNHCWFAPANPCLPNARRCGSCGRRGGTWREYRAVRKAHSLIEICKNPQLAAEVTITAAEILQVDAAIIFADLLLPLEVMGLPFHFSAGEGPVIEQPLRTKADVSLLRTDSARRSGLRGRGGPAGHASISDRSCR